MTRLSAAHRLAGVAIDDEKREKDDFYATPLEGIEALLRVETFIGPIWEPACGDGAISKALEAAGHDVVSTDLVDRGHGDSRIDFLMEYRPRAPNIITNPPYSLAVEFVRHALQLSTAKVAMLLRLSWLEGNERRILFNTSPLARVLVFSRRLQFHRPGWEDTGAGGMIAYAWFVWDHQHSGPPTLGWL